MVLKKILFICGSLQPGHDGVGDYTRELAGALKKIKIDVKIISIRDRQVVNISEEKQAARTESVDVLRLSKILSLRKRKKEFDRLVADYKPDLVSLQYVPYAFSSKGIPLYLSQFLKPKTKVKWHIMIHEAYIGTDGNFKRSIIQRLQTSTLKQLVRILKPSVIHTTIPSYQSQLRAIGIESDIIGLFGNIPIVKKSLFSNENDKNFRGVYFGAPPKEEKFQTFVNAINQYLQKTSDRMELVLCGQSGEKGIKFASALRTGIDSKNFHLEEKGRMETEELSELFLKMDFAIARITPHLLGKSGSAIALLEHGLPLWFPLSISQDEIIKNIDFRVNQCFVDLSQLKKSKDTFIPGSRIEEIADTFIQKLNRSEDNVT